MESKTIVSEYWEKPVQSFFVNAGFGERNREKITVVSQAISQAFPSSVWPVPVSALHITLVDLLSAQTQYAADKTKLFQDHLAEYDAALSEILAPERTIQVTFSQLKVTPEAIVIIGSDNSSFERIREAFNDRVILLPGTKPAPQLIHSTICRYKQETDLAPIERFVSQQNISFVEYVSTLRLVHETIWPLIQFEVVKEYTLKT